MALTRLKKGNSQFPTEKAIGDVVVLALGDMFCWDGGMWQLLGGRFMPKGLRARAMEYFSTGFPDPQSAAFDLPSLLNLENFVDYGPEDLVPADPVWVERFISRTIEVGERCQKAKLA
jgi:hypothetical protein